MAVVTALVAPAKASPVSLSAMVTENPANFTPRITVGNAPFAAVALEGQMFVGGAFSEVQNANRYQTYVRRNLFGFNMSDGSVTSLSIKVDGVVLALATDGTALYVGGKFFSVNGVARRGLVKLDATTGAVDAGFDARLKGAVQDLEVADGRLFVGGRFGKRLTAVDLATGADSGYLNLSITGTTSTDGSGTTDVYRFALSPDKTKLVAVGNFTTVGGQKRWRAFMLNLGATSGSLAPWYYSHLEKPCRLETRYAYLRDVDFSPDGSGFFFVSTGGKSRDGERGLTVCDAAARFDTATASPTRPAWITYTDGDTLLSTVATDSAVYVQGHQKKLHAAGTTAVRREGIGALNPSTGAVLPWDPWKQRGFGGQVLVVTGSESPRAGLWVGSDTTLIGSGTDQVDGGAAGTPEKRERWAFLPAAS